MFVQDPSTQRTTRDKELLLSRIRSHAAHTTRVKKTSKTSTSAVKRSAPPQNCHLYDDELINPRSVLVYRSKTRQLEEQFLIREKSRLERVINHSPSPTSFLGQSKRDPFETNPARRLPLLMHDVWEFGRLKLPPQDSCNGGESDTFSLKRLTSSSPKTSPDSVAPRYKPACW